MKRLLCLISGMNAGGAETFLMKIYRALDKSKYQMDFCINTEGDSFYSSEIKALGGKIYCIPPKSKSLIAFRHQLTAIVKENHYDRVMRITSNAMGFLDLKIAKRAGATTCIARSSNSSDGSSYKTRALHTIGKMLYSRYVDIRIAPSDLAAIHTFGARAYREGRVVLFPNAIDLDIIRYEAAARKQIRAELGIIDDAFVIGHIGRFETQKNHKFLLEIFKEITKLRPEAVLLLVGEGSLQDQIRVQAGVLGVKDRVFFLGVRSDVPQLLSAMDVFVFPSFYEGMPNTVIEAQATGLPCILSDTITQEANITGLVKYLSFSVSPEIWANTALCFAQQERKDERQVFVEKGYDIHTAVKSFEHIVFEDS